MRKNTEKENPIEKQFHATATNYSLKMHNNITTQGAKKRSGIRKINGEAHWGVQRISMHYVNVFQFKIINFTFVEVIFAVLKYYKELLIKKIQ